MKKTLWVFLVFSLLLWILRVSLVFSLLIHGSTPSDWQTLRIDHCGTIKAPSGWTVVVEEDLIYIMDGEKPVMVSQKSVMVSQEPVKYKYYNKYWGEYEYIDSTYSAGLSNNVIYGTAKYNCNNEVLERHFLDLGDCYVGDKYTRFNFVVLDKEMSRDFLVQIAKTFSSKGYDEFQ